MAQILYTYKDGVYANLTNKCNCRCTFCDIVPELAGLLDSVSISLNAPDEKEYNRVTKPTLTGAYKAMLDFAKACKKSIPDTRMTVVDVLSPEDIEKSRKVAASCGIKLRVRKFS